MHPNHHRKSLGARPIRHPNVQKQAVFRRGKSPHVVLCMVAVGERLNEQLNTCWHLGALVPRNRRVPNALPRSRRPRFPPTQTAYRGRSKRNSEKDRCTAAHRPAELPGRNMSLRTGYPLTRFPFFWSREQKDRKQRQGTKCRRTTDRRVSAGKPRAAHQLRGRRSQHLDPGHPSLLIQPPF